MTIRVPGVAWSRALGEGHDPAPRPRVALPMIDDGPWGGVPIGGIGAGSIGRTQRGDFARWHLEIGRHRFASEPLDGFAVWARDDSGVRATVLRTTPPPPSWGEPLAIGSGRYHALFPRAWLSHELDGWPIGVVEEQLSPVIPGDEASASLPVGVFDVEVENRGGAVVEAAVLLSWRDPLGLTGETEADAVVVARALGDGRAGVRFDRSGGQPTSFAIALDARDAETSIATFPARDAAALWTAFGRDGGWQGRQTTATGAPGELAAALAARVRLGPGERRSLRFSVAWDVPTARFGGGRRWRRRYAKEWGTGGTRAAELAGHALRSADAWRAAIEAWQAPIVEATNRPDWYKAALFNELYFLVDGGTIWHDGPVEPIEDGGQVAPEAPPDRLHEPGEIAELGLIECFDYPFYDTLDVHFYAAFAIARLFPRLQASISRAFAGSVAIDDPSLVTIEASKAIVPRKAAGALPHDLGGPTEDPLVRVNHYTFQDVNGWKDLNPKFVLQAWHDRRHDTDPDGYLRAVWPAVRRAMDYMLAFDRDGDGLPEHDGLPDQTYDTWPMHGPSAYGGSLWLAALRAASAFARTAGEPALAAEWDDRFDRAAAAFEARLWNGRSYDYDAGGGPSSDSIMADQLVGQWYADATGLGDLVPPDHARSALRRIFESNVIDYGDGLLGAVNGMRPDGTVDRSSEQSQEVWTGTAYALAAFMIGRGLVDEGWTTAEGVVRSVWERGLWFRTPEAFDRSGNYRAPLYLRPLAIWAIEEALERTRG